jgi:hypothetical protein
MVFLYRIKNIITIIFIDFESSDEYEIIQNQMLGFFYSKI